MKPMKSGCRELAAAIRKGHTMIAEDRYVFLVESTGCAIGAALCGIGYTWHDRLLDQHSGAKESGSAHGLKTYLAAHFGLPVSLMTEISERHAAGTPRLEIADWLDELAPRDERPVPAAPYVAPQPSTAPGRCRVASAAPSSDLNIFFF